MFDDDLGDDNAVQAKSVGRGHKKKDLLKCVPGRKNNIKNMLIGMPSKNKEVGLPLYVEDFFCMHC